MDHKLREFLYRLLTTPSPSGHEQPVQRVVHDHVQEFAESVEPDLHGNLLVGINTKARRRLMLAAHCDQIAFMVKHISKDGYITVEGLGGVDDASLASS